MLDIR